MQFEEVEIESILEQHVKIFVFLASKYITTLIGYDFVDLIHEQKIACIKALDHYEVEKKMGSFLYTIAENRLRGLYKTENRIKRKPKALQYMDVGSVEKNTMSLAECGDYRIDMFYLNQVRENADIVAKQVLSKFEYYLYVKIIKEKQEIAIVAADCEKSYKQVTNGVTRVRSKLRKKRALITLDL